MSEVQVDGAVGRAGELVRVGRGARGLDCLEEEISACYNTGYSGEGSRYSLNVKWP